MSTRTYGDCFGFRASDFGFPQRVLHFHFRICSGNRPRKFEIRIPKSETNSNYRMVEMIQNKPQQVQTVSNIPPRKFCNTEGRSSRSENRNPKQIRITKGLK